MATIMDDNVSFNSSYPIPFITVDSNSNALSLSPAALDRLNAIHTRIAIVSMAGTYRTGKSYLLNMLMRFSESNKVSFSVGSTINACTKGIWMYTLPASSCGSYKHLPSDAVVLYLDTEGLGSTQRSQSHDSRIFALALLLSSLFIYNSCGVIDANAIDELSSVADLSKYVQVHTDKKWSADAEHEQVSFNNYELSDFLPDFIWVVRDFSLQLMENGKMISARKYLENALASSVTNEKNEVRSRTRASLSKCFRSRYCVTMVRPVHDETLLKNLMCQPYETLRGEFRTQVKELQDRINKHLKIKHMMDTPMNGVTFARMTQCYIDAFNSGTVPVISSAWNRVLDSQFKDALRDITITFARQLSGNDAEEEAASEVALNITYEQARDNAENKLIKEIVLPEALIDYLLQLSSNTLHLLGKMYDQIEERSIKHNHSLLENISSTLTTKYSYLEKCRITQAPEAYLTHFRKKLELLIKEYREKAYGPMQDMILAQYLTTHITDGLCEWSTALKSTFRDQESQYQTKINKAKQLFRATESRSRAAQEIIEQQKTSYERAIKSIVESANDERLMFRSEIDMKHNEIISAREQFMKLCSFYTNETENLKGQIAAQIADRKQIEESSYELESRLQNACLASQREVLENERNFYKEEKESMQIQQSLVAKILDLEHQMEEQETAHMRDLHHVEKQGILARNELMKKLEHEEEAIKMETIKSIRMIKEEGEAEIAALDMEYDEKKACVASLKEKIRTKEALVSSRRQPFTYKEECSLQ